MADQTLAAWHRVSEHVRKKRGSRVYMPAALIVAIDLIAETPHSEVFDFDRFEAAYKGLMSGVSPSGAARAWQPFFHLGRGAAAWALMRDDSDAVIESSPTSRRGLLAVANRARLTPDLVRELRQDAQGARQCVRHILSGDDCEDSRALLVATGQ